VLRGLRGSAPAGLAGIAARDRRAGAGCSFARRELLAYVAERGLRSTMIPPTATRGIALLVRTTLLRLLHERLGPRVRSDLLAQGRHAAVTVAWIVCWTGPGVSAPG